MGIKVTFKYSFPIFSRNNFAAADELTVNNFTTGHSSNVLQIFSVLSVVMLLNNVLLTFSISPLNVLPQQPG